MDPELREWMMPAFSTTQENDKVVASVLMMASMRKYYSFGGRLCCGLPRVTLLGEKKDWQLILGRLEKLSSWGEEPALFERLLKPVLQRFVRSFDEPKGEEIMRFWGQIAHYIERFSGPSLYSGWITAFCLWDDEGKCMYRKPEKMEQLTLDGAAYHWIESDMVPPGYASVPVKVDDNGDEFDAVMVAGSVGIKASWSVCGGSERLDTMSAESGWWIFEKKDARPVK